MGPSKLVNEIQTTFKNQITQQNKVEPMQESDDEEFIGFTTDDLEERPKPLIVSGNTFGIEGLEYYEILQNQEEEDEQSANTSKLKVIFSDELLAHMKKVLKKDKQAMAVLNKIKKDQGQSNQPTATVQIEKGPSDYPMPPSPESNSPSDTSDKGSTSPQTEATTTTLVKSDLTSSRSKRRSARTAC